MAVYKDLKNTCNLDTSFKTRVYTEDRNVYMGEDGATFTPKVSSEGELSWTNDKGLVNPEPVNIKGPEGQKGDKGDKGEQGIQGEPGLKGETGEQGIQGPKGEQGEQGIQGVQGIQGPKGDTGETGAQGPIGIQGPTGEQGLPGKDGYTPQRGVDYWTEADKEEINAETQLKLKDYYTKKEIESNIGGMVISAEWLQSEKIEAVMPGYTYAMPLYPTDSRCYEYEEIIKPPKESGRYITFNYTMVRFGWDFVEESSSVAKRLTKMDDKNFYYKAANYLAFYFIWDLTLLSTEMAKNFPKTGLYIWSDKEGAVSNTFVSNYYIKTLNPLIIPNDILKDTDKAVPNGLATLTSEGKVEPEQLPETISYKTSDKAPADINKLWIDPNDDSGEGGASIIIDTTMSDTSLNPVANKTIKAYIDNKIAQIVDGNKERY